MVIDRVNAPGPRGFPLLGSALPFRRDPISYMVKAWRNHGDITRFNIRGKILHLLVRPEHIQHVLVSRRENYYKGYGYHDQKLLLGEGLITSEGELWEQQHRLMQPFFTPRGICHFTDIMFGATRRMLERWNPMADGRQTIHIDKEMARLTGNIIVQALFNRDLDDEVSPIDEAFQYCIGFIDKRSANLIALPMCVPTAAHRRFKRHLSTVYRYIEDRIVEHRESQEDDLLSMLMNARNDDDKPMHDKQLRDELVTLFVAGYQTTMHALTWTLFLIDRYPDISARLLKKQHSVLGDRDPTASDLRDLSYTSMVFKESMRLYPPVKVVVRQAREADVIGGFDIPAGSLVLVSPYITHRHPDLWAEPEQFDPQRFAPEKEKNQSRYAYIPFSAGPRVCLGDHFALLEASIVLTMVIQRYTLKVLPGHSVIPSMDVKTRPLFGMPMTLHPRT